MPNDRSMWKDIEHAMAYRRYIEGDLPDLRAWEIAVRMANSVGLNPTWSDCFRIQEQKTRLALTL